MSPTRTSVTRCFRDGLVNLNGCVPWRLSMHSEWKTAGWRSAIARRFTTGLTFQTEKHPSTTSATSRLLRRNLRQINVRLGFLILRQHFVVNLDVPVLLHPLLHGGQIVFENLVLAVSLRSFHQRVAL